MREPSRFKTTVAPLLAFLVPGGGHLLLGRPGPGLLLLLGTLTDIAAMIRLADESGGKFALFILLLGLGLPAFWFYSVFGALQLAARIRREGMSEESERSGGLLAVAQGMATIALACVLWVLVQTSADFSTLIESFGTYAPGPLLMALALAIALRRKNAMFKIGRFTAAAVLVGVGALLLWDQLKGRNDIGLLGQWWPAAFVLLGIEVVVSSLAYRRAARRPSFDVGGAFIAAVVAVTAFAVTQYAAMPFKWLDEFKVNLTGTSELGEEKGFHYAKDAIHQPLLPETTSIAIDNLNGNVTVKKGSVNELVIETVVWVDAEDKAEADKTAEKSAVDVNGGQKVQIKAQGQPYGTNGERKPRMNMVVTIPENSAFGMAAQPPGPGMQPEAGGTEGEETAGNAVPANGGAGNAGSGNAVSGNGTAGAANESATSAGHDSSNHTETPKTVLYISTVNGSVDAADLLVTGGLTVKVTTGEISVRQIRGPVDAETKNGSITARTMEGDVKLSTYNGDIEASDIGGGFDGSTLSGSIDLKRVSGDVDTDTKNGQIGIQEAFGAVRADTLNGDIRVASGAVGGDWDIDSSIGEIQVMIPEAGNYSVNGSVTFGDISSDLPLAINKKTIRGSIGEGAYRINIDANSSIAVNRYKP
ncbi:DUF4097 family beta strand repeat protein [Paenibacillus sp. MWE-103]|uniref:DUF4097 family beta strand repeat protein n=1 Tax=Paenibacillus artemisiicola TaxID=1172618 RepID=A0ABS3WHS1_9BACL|nr:DUF4097 family beta strand repeat-containing protein [Paenibacillus artemisiicola]MBO7747874.1 DUF4097 family beta strand repeat protein [Paenibacillus artemisiicola]